MDQGLVQKLWSMLAETREFSLPMLNKTVQRLAPFAPDHLIWIEIPSRIAAERIAGRTGGNSRFDGRPRIETTARLDKLLDLYNLIMGLFKQHMDSRVTFLRGEDPVAASAARINLLIKSEMNPD